MAEFNRYTQMPAPLIVNPISFEDFAKVPLMKARATGETVGAAERINTEYNVDDADLGKISTLVEGIDKLKEGIVTDITNNGINSQSIGQVITLKRERDKLYKNKIQQAEENKKLLFAWRQKIDDMVMRGTISPEYGEKIKQKEYGKWVDKGGTFANDNDSDLPRMFQENFGVKYFDIDKDIREQLNEIKNQETIKGTSWAGGKSHVEQGDGFTQLVTSGGGSRTKASNESNLDAAINRIYQEYSDPNTERGQFVQYADVDISSLKGRLQKYKQEFLAKKDITQVDNSQRQLLGDGSGKDNSNDAIIDTENNPIRESKYKINKDLKSVTNTNWKELVTIDEEFRKKQKDKPWYTITKPGDLLDVINKIRKSGNSDPKTIKDKILLIYKFPSTIDKLIDSGDLTPAMVYNAKGGQIKWINHVIDKISDYQEKNVTPNQQSKIVTEDYMRTSWGLDISKSNPEGSAQDIYKGTYNFYNLENRKIADKDEQEEIRAALGTKGAEVQGNIPMLSPDLLDENGEVLSNLSGGRKFTVTDPKSKYFGKSYYAELPPSLKETKNFKRIKELNERILSLSVADQTDNIVYRNNKGGFERAKVIHIDSAPGTYDVVTSDGQFTLNDNPQLLTRMYGEDYFNNYIYPELTKKK